KGDPFLSRSKEKEKSDETQKEGSKLVLYNLETEDSISFPEVGEYKIDKNGEQVVFLQNNITRDSIRSAGVLLYTFQNKKTDTLRKSINTAKNFAFTEDGEKLAFVAESDDDSKVKPKLYKLLLFKKGEQK